MKRPVLALLLAVSVLLSGCAKKPSYEQKEKFLDRVSADGVTYRQQLLKQHTPPSVAACRIGFDLRDYAIPRDLDGVSTSDVYADQVEEAFIRSCATGEPRPKPEPAGTKGISPVPHQSPTPTAPSLSPLGTG